MKKEESNINIKIEYKDDLEARYKIIDFIIEHLMKMKQEVGDKNHE